MAVKRCVVCGREFDAGKGNRRVCDECRHVTCPVCGREMELSGPKLTKYVQRGWVTCGRQECAKEMTRRGLIEREGITNVSQRADVRAKISEARKSESDETRARRAQAIRKACASEDVKRRRRETMMARYGKSSSLDLDGVREIGNEASKGAHKNVTGDAIEGYLAEHPGASISEVASALGLNYQCVQKQNKNHDIGIKLGRSNSFNEKVVASFLDSLGIEYRRNVRSVIAPYELDFYMERGGYKVAIEVNDFATHNIDRNPYGGSAKPRGYHWMKTRMCDEAGVRLIHAWEHCLPTWGGRCRFGSWEVLKNCIEHALGMSRERVYARDLKVVRMPSAQVSPFFRANNVNGHRGAWEAWCLVPKRCESPTWRDVLMAYSVGQAHFGKGKYDAEIARGACRLGLTVVGGASKLWSHIISETEYHSIVYYSDRNYYQNASFGFLDGVTDEGHSDSFWNFWPHGRDGDATPLLTNREPRRHGEIVAARESGECWEIESAGTDVHVWRRG